MNEQLALQTAMPPIISGSSFTVHSGNVNNYLELVTRRHKNSAAEIAAAFKYLAAQNTVFRLTESVFSPTTEVLQDPKNDVKTSLKVCLSTFSANDVQNAVHSHVRHTEAGIIVAAHRIFPL
ncbi:hypothetical protein COOONC_05131 [Cooperia oncophora]